MADQYLNKAHKLSENTSTQMILSATETSQTNKSPTISSKQKFISALVAAEADQGFYWVDTIIKRLQNSHEPIKNLDTFKQVIFLPNTFSSLGRSDVAAVANPSKMRAIQSLFDGFWSGAANKALTRTYRFYFQDQMQDKTKNLLDPIIGAYLPENKSKTLYGGISGVASGVSEAIVFQPLDTFKTRQQLRSTAIKGGFYNGLGSSILRNGACAGIFFGGYNYFISFSKDKNKPSTKENLLAVTGAGLINSVLTNPLDVAKTRLQASQQKMTSLSMFRKIVAEEGLGALTKGTAAKMVQTPMKSILPFFAYQVGKNLWEGQANKNKVDRDNLSPDLK